VEIRQELQEAHTTGEEQSSSWVYNLNARCKRLDILEGPATAQAQKGCAENPGTGSIKVPATQLLKILIK
jgi:hypothetical protein